VVVLISIEDASNALVEAEKTGAAAFVRKQDFKPSLLRKLWMAHGKESPRLSPDPG
jgi:hypothetical protein